MLYASYSELTDLEYTSNNLSKLLDLRIERTPLENDDQKIWDLITSLKDRQGNPSLTLSTYSFVINNLALPNNWIINP